MQHSQPLSAYQCPIGCLTRYNHMQNSAVQDTADCLSSFLDSSNKGTIKLWGTRNK